MRYRLWAKARICTCSCAVCYDACLASFRFPLPSNVALTRSSDVQATLVLWCTSRWRCRFPLRSFGFELNRSGSSCTGLSGAEVNLSVSSVSLKSVMLTWKMPYAETADALPWPGCQRPKIKVRPGVGKGPSRSCKSSYFRMLPFNPRVSQYIVQMAMEPDFSNWQL